MNVLHVINLILTSDLTKEEKDDIIRFINDRELEIQKLNTFITDKVDYYYCNQFH